MADVKASTAACRHSRRRGSAPAKDLRLAGRKLIVVEPDHLFRHLEAYRRSLSAISECSGSGCSKSAPAGKGLYLGRRIACRLLSA